MADNIIIIDAAELNTLNLLRYLKKTSKELIRFRYGLVNFIRRRLITRYRRSLLGVAWSIINPFIKMLVLTAVFSFAFKIPIENYSIYVFSGIVAWEFISSSYSFGTQAFIQSESYIRKIYIPKILFPITIVSVEFINLIASMISLFILIIVLNATVSISILLLPIVFILIYFFVLGGTMIVSVITVYFRDLSHIVQVVFGSVLFYLTPIIYDVNIIPIRYQWLLKLNPFYYFIEIYHSIIYRAELPSIELWVACLILSLLSLFLGLTMLAWRENDLVFRL